MPISLTADCDASERSFFNKHCDTKVDGWDGTLRQLIATIGGTVSLECSDWLSKKGAERSEAEQAASKTHLAAFHQIVRKVTAPGGYTPGPSSYRKYNSDHLRAAHHHLLPMATSKDLFAALTSFFDAVILKQDNGTQLTEVLSKLDDTAKISPEFYAAVYQGGGFVGDRGADNLVTSTSPQDSDSKDDLPIDRPLLRTWIDNVISEEPDSTV